MTSLTPELVRLLQAERERQLRRDSVARAFRAAIACCREPLSFARRLAIKLGLAASSR